MEIKSVCDCLNSFDSIISGNIHNHIVVENLENIHNLMIGMYNDKYIEDFVILTGVLSQINLIIEILYKDNESNLREEYRILRQHMLAWLMENKNLA